MEREYQDLECLIMFLVFEKQVLSFDDDSSELDLYFLDKHTKRMNRELHAYKAKMNIKNKMKVFKVQQNNSIYYIAAYTEKQARYIAYENMIQIEEIESQPLGDLMYNGTTNITLKELIKNAQPCILGNYDVSNYEEEEG